MRRQPPRMGRLRTARRRRLSITPLLFEWIPGPWTPGPARCDANSLVFLARRHEIVSCRVFFLPFSHLVTIETSGGNNVFRQGENAVDRFGMKVEFIYIRIVPMWLKRSR